MGLGFWSDYLSSISLYTYGAVIPKLKHPDSFSVCDLKPRESVCRKPILNLFDLLRSLACTNSDNANLDAGIEPCANPGHHGGNRSPHLWPWAFTC